MQGPGPGTLTYEEEGRVRRHPQTTATGRSRAGLVAALALCLLAGVLVGCGRTVTPIRPTSPAPGKAPVTTVVLATTDVVHDSGLAAAIQKGFRETYPQFRVDLVAGTVSSVVAAGRSGHAAVLLVDSPAKVAAMVASGEASQSKAVMQGDFVIVGPSGDPASAGTAASAAAALKAIAAHKATFVSAGGDEALSGAEAALWASAGVDPKGAAWHLSAASGADALRTASAKDGYTLVEGASWLAAKSSLNGSAVLVSGEKAPADKYVAVLMKGAANPAAAVVLANWLSGPAGQEVIGAYGVVKFGQRIFNANAL